MNTILQATRKQTQIVFTYYLPSGPRTFSIEQKDTNNAIPKLQQWAVDLRENQNSQGCGRLHYLENDQNKYCCLGILGKNLPTFSTYYLLTFLAKEDFKMLLNLGTLSDAAAMQTFFSGLNDEYLFTFEEIATVIEKFITFFQSNEPMLVIMR